MAIADAFFKISLILLTIIASQGCAGLSNRSDTPCCLPVRFSYEGYAQSICIAGDFNHWSPDAHCLRKIDRKWIIDLKLPAGIHHYAFVIDGAQWVADPKAPLLEADGFGKQNSAVLVD